MREKITFSMQNPYISRDNYVDARFMYGPISIVLKSSRNIIKIV